MEPIHNKEQNGKNKISDSVSNLILKYRVVLLSLLIVLVVGGVGAAVFVTVTEKISESAFTELDILEANLTEENEIETRSTLEAFAEKNKTRPAGARAYMLVADIYFSDEKWENAKEAYLNAASANPSAYTAPLSIYNAAVCAEELGDTSTAIELFTKAAEAENFTLVPRAYFNLGRIEDTLGNFDAAVAYYDTVFEQFPNDSWAYLAKSRSLSLRAEGKAE